MAAAFLSAESLSPEAQEALDAAAAGLNQKRESVSLHKISTAFECGRCQISEEDEPEEEEPEEDPPMILPPLPPRTAKPVCCLPFSIAINE